MRMKPMPQNSLSKTDIIQAINYEKNNMKVICGLLIMMIVIGILLYTFLDSLLLAIILTLILYGGINAGISFAWYKKFHNFSLSLNQEELRDQIIRIALPEGLQNVSFHPEISIPEAVLKVPQLPFTIGCDSYCSGNYAAGMAITTPLEAEYAIFGKLRREYDTSDEPGRPGTYEVLDESFNGMIYICHLQRAFVPLTVCSKCQSGNYRTGDSGFDSTFSVHASDPEAVPTVLTDSLRRYLTEAVGSMKGKLYIYFSADGNLYAAFDQPILNSTVKNGTEPFETLSRQISLIKGLINGLTAGYWEQ